MRGQTGTAPITGHVYDRYQIQITLSPSVWRDAIPAICVSDAHRAHPSAIHRRLVRIPLLAAAKGMS